MCGVAGIAGPVATRERGAAMLDRLAHRGPDGRGEHAASNAYLGHHRLAIVDPDGGAQPFVDPGTGVAIICNGAIYNHEDLRPALIERGYHFKSGSDCEVILHGYLAWGLGLLDRIDGIFALAIWDPRSRQMHLARDHFGVKPLVYMADGHNLRFASEAKAIFADPCVRRALDRHSFHAFMNLRYAPGEGTLFEGVKKLPAASVLTWREGGEYKIRRYYGLPDLGDRPISIEVAAEETRARLQRAVKRQLMADVQIGTYLSGGLDSSAITALAAGQDGAPFDSFAMGFGGPDDELDDARVVAKAFGTNHHEFVAPDAPLAGYPATIWHCEEPKENVLQGYLLSEFASSRVKVALTGLGGDELFAGYHINRILEGLDRFTGAASIPGLRHALAAMEALTVGTADGRVPARMEHYVRGLQVLLACRDPARGYAALRNAWGSGLGAAARYYGDAINCESLTPAIQLYSGILPQGRVARMGDIERAEFQSKMVDDLLLNEDRTAMAHGVETRVPFLDRELVEFAFSIPYGAKLERHRTKAIIREAMIGVLPKATLTKRKAGFTFDSARLFQSELREAAARILTPDRVKARGWFDPARINTLLNLEPHPHLRWHFFVLWLAVGFEIWGRIFIDENAAPEGRTLKDFYA